MALPPQATLMGVISAAMFFVLSNTKPLGRLSAQRPHPSIFCAYVFLSLLGQFLVHLAFLAGMYHVAKSGMSAVRCWSGPFSRHVLRAHVFGCNIPECFRAHLYQSVDSQWYRYFVSRARVLARLVWWFVQVSENKCSHRQSPCLACAATATADWGKSPLFVRHQHCSI